MQTPAPETVPNPFSSFTALAHALRGSSPTSNAAQTLRPSAPPVRHRRLSRTSGTRIRSPSSSLRIRSDIPVEDFVLEPSAHANGGLINAVNSAGNALARKLWIGVLDVPALTMKESDKPRIQEALRVQADNVPVWVTDEEFQQHYDVFCHQVLWPRWVVIWQIFESRLTVWFQACIMQSQTRPKPRHSTRVHRSNSIKQ